MKLVRAHVRNFRSTMDSGEFEIGQRTCLVGKNEAGKTAVLQALHGVNPTDGFSYDVERDYPRAQLNDYLEKEQRSDKETLVSRTTWALEDDEVEALEAEFGPDCLNSKNIVISSHYGGKQTWATDRNEPCIVAYLLDRFELDEAERAGLDSAKFVSTLLQSLRAVDEPTERQVALREQIETYRDERVGCAIIDRLTLPRFMYFSHYDRMSGQVSIDQLLTDQKAGTVTEGDGVFLDFLSYAGTDLDTLKEASTFETLNTRAEAASNRITDQIFEYWSQNDSLRIEVRITRGEPKDAPPFNEGTVVRARVANDLHRVTVPFSERSAGFIWFFSFLVKFAQVKKTHDDVVILLDEPGLTLHGKAQADLLRYFAEQLEDTHQVIYSTHSPFMVPAEDLGCVRTVEDVVERGRGGRPRSAGTAVRSDVLTTDRDTLFPLQGALGYELTQSLFVGPNTLLVEGPSEILYLQSFSRRLKELGRTGLDARWTLAPSGGIGNMMPMVNLFAGNRLNVAVLVDVEAGNRAPLRKLEQMDVLSAEAIYRITDFVDQNEGDVEDLLGGDLYASLLNEAFSVPKERKITAKTLSEVELSTSRLAKRAEALFRVMPPDAADFDHYAPAWLLHTKASFLKSTSKYVEAALSRFETLFVEVNDRLGPR